MGAQHFGQRGFGLDDETDRTGNERFPEHSFLILLPLPLRAFSLLRRLNCSSFLTLGLTKCTLCGRSAAGATEAWIGPPKK